RSATKSRAAGVRISSDRSTPAPRISMPLLIAVATATSVLHDAKAEHRDARAATFERGHGSGLPRPRPWYSPGRQTPLAVSRHVVRSPTNEHVEPLQIVPATPPVEAT